MDEQKFITYANEAKVLRSLVYYNMAQLWGNIQYTTVGSLTTDTPIMSSREICQEINNTLQSIEMLPEGENRVTLETVKALRGEIALSLGNKDEAKILLSNCHADFSILIYEQEHKGIYKLYGDKIPNYTSEKIELLREEANLKDTDDTFSLIENWKNKELYWGYWIMLKRTKQAQSVCGCEEYEVLMPIPERALEIVPSLKQNPGY